MDDVEQELTIGRARVAHLTVQCTEDVKVDGRLQKLLESIEGVLSSEASSEHALVIYDPVKLCHHDLVEAIERLGGSSHALRATVVYVMPLSAALRVPYTSPGTTANA